MSPQFAEELRKFAETVIFSCKMKKKCGDLRSQRIRAKTAQKNNKIMAREIPQLSVPTYAAGMQALPHLALLLCPFIRFPSESDT